jgi:hypothetical protein
MIVTEDGKEIDAKSSQFRNAVVEIPSSCEPHSNAIHFIDLFVDGSISGILI